MTLLDRAIATSLPLAPRALVERVAARYLAGPTVEDAMRVVCALADEGVRSTVDVLGEEVVSDAEADAAVEEYERVLDALSRTRARAGISVKLSAFALRRSEDGAHRRLTRLLAAAEAAGGRFVRIDMEDSSTTDATLRAYERLRADGHTRVGVVLQAMLRRSLGDVRRLLALGEPDVRVCKGIYVEPYRRAFLDPELVRSSYVRMCRELLEGGGRLGVATHDERLVYSVRALGEELDPTAARHEFQMLLGVEAPLRDLLVEEGAPLRIYVPYGARAYEYALRRLQENPAVAGHVTKDLWRRTRAGVRARRHGRG